MSPNEQWESGISISAGRANPPLVLDVPHGSSVLVGRDPRCDIVVPDPTVSRRHARVFWEDETLVVEDQGSSGGTFLNGIRVTRSGVQPGDIVRLGPRAEMAVADRTPSSLLRATGRDQRGVEQLQVMLEVARALNAATVVDEVLAVVLEAAVNLVGADQGCVMLESEDGKLDIAAVWPPGVAEQTWGDRSSLVSRAMVERSTVTLEGGGDPSTSMMGRGFEVGLATPLVVARRPMGMRQDVSFVASVEVIGGLLVEKREGGSFRGDRLAVFESLAADAAMAIDSARLYRESRDKVKIEHEMDLARTIQAALLHAPPAVSFAELAATSRSARAVGGDLYHCALRGDGTLGLTLGDVAGKGVPAALIMATAQGSLELLHDLQIPIEDLASHLNRSLAASNPGNRFLTLVAALLAPDGRVTLVNAGHCPAALVRTSGEVELASSDGPVLGILPVASWSTQELQMLPGDLLVFYSDGLTESFDPRGCEFGELGVVGALGKLAGAAPRDVASALLAAATAHRGREEAEDDVTILVARYQPSPAS